MRNVILFRALAAGALVAALGSGCQDKAPAPDNTKVNQRDTKTEASATKTPLDQGQNKGDIDITAAIRRDLMSNDRLSTTAKNVKIITTDGNVTLRGPVKSEGERADIAAAVEHVDGVRQVDNQLEVAP
ncbi:MAG: BON domain-containing protein [Polyangiaceae bacterium]